jgi:hypothetical protein
MNTYNQDDDENSEDKDEKVAEMFKYRYNVINYFIENDNNNIKLFFDLTFYVIVMCIFLIIICCNIDYDVTKHISVALISFEVLFVLLYYYYKDIFKLTPDITSYKDYFKNYNDVVKYCYNKNNPNTPFIDNTVYKRNVEKYEGLKLKNIDIAKLQSDAYNKKNPDFLKYFILDTKKYLKDLDNYIAKEINAYDITGTATITKMDDIFKYDLKNKKYHINITKFNDTFREKIKRIKYGNTEVIGPVQITPVDGGTLLVANNLIDTEILKNCINKDARHKLIQRYSSGVIIDTGCTTDMGDIMFLDDLYEKYKEIIEEYYFYKNYISLDDIRLEISKTNYDLLSADDREEFPTGTYWIYLKAYSDNKKILNSVVTDITIQAQLSNLYKKEDYDVLIYQHFFKYKIYYILYIIAYVFLFTILLHFICHYTDKTIIYIV